MVRLRDALAVVAVATAVVVILYFASPPLVLRAELISNTDQCLSNCELVFRFRLNRDYNLTDPSEFEFKYRKDKYALDLKDYGIQILEEVSYNESIPEIICYPYNITTPNQTLTYPNCTTIYHTEERTKDVWVDLKMPYSFTKNKWYYIKIWGTKQAELGENNIEVLPELLGKRLKFTWWNSSWTRCRNITFSESENLARTLEPHEIWVNDSDIQAGCQDIRIVDRGCNDGGSEVPSVLTYNTSSECKVLITPNVSASDGLWATNTTYSVYYKNPMADYPDYPDAVTKPATNNFSSAYYHATWATSDCSFSYLADETGRDWGPYYFLDATKHALYYLRKEGDVDVFGRNVACDETNYPPCDDLRCFVNAGESDCIINYTLYANRWKAVTNCSASKYRITVSFANASDGVDSTDYACIFENKCYQMTGSPQHHWGDTGSGIILNDTDQTISWVYELNYTEYIDIVNWNDRYEDVWFGWQDNVANKYVLLGERTFWSGFVNSTTDEDSANFIRQLQTPINSELGTEESLIVDTCTPGATVWNMNCNDNCTKTGEVITVNGPWNIYGSNGYFLCDGCTLIVNETTNNATNCKLLFTGDFKYITR